MVSKKQKATHKTQHIFSLTEDLLIKIASLCAASSIFNLLPLRCVCKHFKKICDDKEVLRKVSLENVNFTPIGEDTGIFYQRYSKLRVAGNSEALYHLGILLYFHDNKRDVGLKLLQEAAEAKCRDAQYVYGTILICIGGEAKLTGFDIMKSFLRPMMSETLKELCKYSWRINVQLFPVTYSARSELRVNYVKDTCACNGQTNKFLSLNNIWHSFGAGQDMKSSEACLNCL